MATNETPDDVIRRNIPRELPCKLTDEEFTRIARQRATKEAERDELVDDLAREKKKRQDQIDDIDDEISKMGRELHTGFQERTIKCVEIFRKGPDGVGYVHTMRTDTFDEVERRPATAHETQRHLPAVDGGGTVGILDKARERQRSAQDDASDVPDEGVGPESESDETSDSEAKPKRRRGKKAEE